MIAQQTIPASKAVIRGPLPALDDVVPADVDCRRDTTATAVIAARLVVPVELCPAGIVVTARPTRRNGSSWES